MGRKEEIIKAAGSFSKEYNLTRYEDGEMLDGCEVRAYIDGFFDGARWADEHPADKA